jgi:hypothetical protein
MFPVYLSAIQERNSIETSTVACGSPKTIHEFSLMRCAGKFGGEKMEVSVRFVYQAKVDWHV